MVTATGPVTLSDVPRLRQIDAQHIAHARKCKRDLSDCATCNRAMAWYGSLPALVLSRVLEDRPALKSRAAS